jgi:hypothetical protein
VAVAVAVGCSGTPCRPLSRAFIVAFCADVID